MILNRITPPSGSVITLEEAKAQARVEVDEDDELIQSYIDAATEFAEYETGRAFLEQQWEMVLDRFPREPDFCMPKPPLISIDEISYLSPAGEEAVWDADNYRVIAGDEGRVLLRSGSLYPSITVEGSAVSIRFTAGYGDHDRIPAGIRSAIRMLVAEMYENRESTVLTGAIMQEVPYGVKAQLWPFVVGKFGV